jgi:hypothetical protein
MILLMQFQNEEEFTPAPLCNVNGVKYDIKGYKCPCDFTSTLSFSL